MPVTELLCLSVTSNITDPRHCCLRFPLLRFLRYFYVCRQYSLLRQILQDLS
jgi:hypothetical protein